MNAAKLTLKFLQNQRNDTKLEEFYSKIVEMSKNITDEPTLPRCQKQPRHVEDGELNYRHDNPKSLFRKHYFEALDILCTELANRFQQTRGMPVAAAFETLLINAANSSSNEDKYPDECSKDLNIERLLIQLKMIPDLLKTYNEKNSHVQIKKGQ